MKNLILALFYLFAYHIVYGNDGTFYAKGNQLIPVQETDISVKKEILSVKNVANKSFEITVYYEFFNPTDDKTITVGFEAFSPFGDVDGAPKNGEHPNMRDFTVNVNNELLEYKVALVQDTFFIKNGQINQVQLNKIDGRKSGNMVDFNYVYHFNATFRKGLNIVKHTYNFDISNSISYFYEFEYNLTAAKRWANKQIDDFTLILDLGEFETFSVDKTFFKSENEWILNGIGNSAAVSANPDFDWERNGIKFNIQKGFLIFQQTNFKIEGDLFIHSKSNYSFENPNPSFIPFSYYNDYVIQEPTTDFQKKALKNLPFARRGYVFKNSELLDFYKKFDWYIPNPNYTPNAELLSDAEKRWYEKWK